VLTCFALQLQPGVQLLWWELGKHVVCHCSCGILIGLWLLKWHAATA
jgi:hypothetical protein